MTEESLSEQIQERATAAGAEAVAVAYYDYHTQKSFGHNADRWFHAASTMKVPVLLGVFAAIDQGTLHLDSRLHVRNQFFSVADGRPYRVESSRDAGADVHSMVGKTMKIRDLAKQMIVTSSNLATNLLVDLIGIESIEASLSQLGTTGIELHRGVEDEAAFEAGISNRVTAAGLVQVLRAIEDAALSEESSREMLDILHAQEFRSGIPAGLPDTARVANKTGEISTVTHDAGLVYLGERPPYAIAILTEWDAGTGGSRRDTLADLSRLVFEHLTADGSDA